MSFSFKHRKDTAAQVRAIAASQIEAAISAAEAGADFDETVHGLRRRCKKVRGLLRLVRPHFEEFSQENAAFRDAAKMLSGARDAAVMVGTFDMAMRQPWVADSSWDRKQALRQMLENERQKSLLGEDRERLLEDFAGLMKKALKRVDDWSLDGDGFNLFGAGLRDTYGAMRNALKKAAGPKATAHDFHEWRKETKYHRFHVGLFRRAAPHVLSGRKSHLDSLGDLLGDHHNLAVLADRLTELAGPIEADLLAGLSADRNALAAKALPLGRELTIENAAVLKARFGKFWKLLPKDD